MTDTAVIAGVGPGLGAAIARRFVEEGCSVGLFARSDEYIDDLSADLGDDAVAIPTDTKDPDAVEEGFDTVRNTFGPVDILVYNASGGGWNGLQATNPATFGQTLNVAAGGALLCSQEAVADMLAGDGGTIIFTGATSSVRGRDGALGFSAGKFAARGMAQSMARELGPEGIHVAHTVIDGQIGDRETGSSDERDVEFLNPDAIADSYWQLVEQDKSAWTLELDLRPHVEPF